ncbi:two component transcriptional regulator, LuxR family [Chitinophaga terrae (ex Kim and Jung 2007)]|jgi:DNA-binding NarL/FixJ family response regulator|uniref:Two component transcriptional regulator, LuxR family n=1 Tax=Chitinophaga terrae (ex Kim and Jung 2007) TaxID=408074 RepID=A0A1H4FMA6_9BACT|nr:response regulator transcription factor [Chitinophaga terrae (ex Kim and Jung 2007)]GEP89020.1 DNA-binding response regulator [Chitinophaga terrae (ex Kim and Jung 2007)]SEA97960.1 two component transcriptional regulator, LuxR family [Chitinophaga terrae (ex Kim and Jung 2007)]
MNITIGIADDHQLFLKSLSLLINSFEGFQIIVEAVNGEELLAKLTELPIPPDIILIDVNMPVLDGAATTQRILSLYPNTKVIALSMKDNDASIIEMLKAGCCAYLLKDIHPAELEKALREVNDTGAYYNDAANVNYRRLLIQTEQNQILTEREREFLSLACSDLTYKAIAAKMNVTERTVDGYRETLFHKLNVQSRTGMVLEALRRQLISL